MISVEDISKSFGSIGAVENLSFEIGAGEIVGLLGPNGAGKTTTMRIMSGFLSPDKGDVIVEDISVFKNPTEAQQLIGYLPENNPLYKEMLVSELLDISAGLRGVSKADKKETLDFVVDAVNINDIYYRPVGELSKGFKQRVGLAVALLHQPKALILDEPTEGLDPNQRAEIRKLIKKLAKKHTVLISTHIMQEVEALCSRVIIIDEGRLVIDGLVDDIASSTKDARLVQITLEGTNVKKELSLLKDVRELNVESAPRGLYHVRLVTDKDVAVQPELSKLAGKNNWTIWELKEEKRLLEDVFAELTK
ncbi:ATP-binding cassette domain-containing protein [bacterium]|nr:ATP-binding cassette domain-containing protein [bacterium]